MLDIFGFSFFFSGIFDLNRRSNPRIRRSYLRTAALEHFVFIRVFTLIVQLNFSFNFSQICRFFDTWPFLLLFFSVFYSIFSGFDSRRSFYSSFHCQYRCDSVQLANIHWAVRPHFDDTHLHSIDCSRSIDFSLFVSCVIFPTLPMGRVGVRRCHLGTAVLELRYRPRRGQVGPAPP